MTGVGGFGSDIFISKLNYICVNSSYRGYLQFRSSWVPGSSMYMVGPRVGKLRLGGVKALSPLSPGKADLDWGVSGLGRIALFCCGQGDGVCLLFPVICTEINPSFLLNLKLLPSCFTTQVISCLTREFIRANLKRETNIRKNERNT